MTETPPANRGARAPHAHFAPSRRGLLLGLAATLVVGQTRAAFAQLPGERRFVVILLRGAMDGLHVVPPYGDAGLAALRGDQAMKEPGQEGGALDLGGQFGLHPALSQVHAMFRANEALVLHAVAGPYRSRSHFEAQDLLEAGASSRMTSGWLNRAIQGLPNPRDARLGLAVGTSVPLLMRGEVPVGAYAPPGLEGPSEDLIHRIAALQQQDPRLARAFAEGMRARGFATQTLGAQEPDAERFSFPRLAGAAARLLSEAGGPRVAALEIGGWDTHAAQAVRIQNPLRSLDAGLAALKTGLGAHWARTAVLVVTEFGRTARMNGNRGTDHGTAGVAFLAGGAVAGGRVQADWPGLGGNSLLEDRDLRPTTDLRSLAKGLLRDHLKLPERAVAQAFPDSRDAAPLSGVLRA